jgi:K+-sensing histidine kinase KdpD
MKGTAVSDERSPHFRSPTDAPSAPFEPDFAGLVRALLVAAADIGRFDVTYLTTINWDQREEVVYYAHNVGAVTVAEGHTTPCPPDLSPQLFAGVTRSNGQPAPQPDSVVARGLSLGTYVSVPIVTLSHRLYGTFCGASRQRQDVADATISAMEHFARLLADFLGREGAAAAERRATWALDQLRARGQFLAEAEHRLKSPLSVISGWAAMLSENSERLSEEQRARGIKAIREHSGVLFDEVVQMLEEATAEVQIHDIDPVDIDVAALVRETVIDLAGSLPRHRITAEGSASVHALTDAALVRKVIAHLVDNAAKYSPAQTSIQLSTHRTEGWAVIDVRDEGVGVPEGFDMFAAFKRGDDPRVKATDGSGLGLHIVRKMVQAMGGMVTARPNEGAGSTVTVRLPAPA